MKILLIYLMTLLSVGYLLVASTPTGTITKGEVKQMQQDIKKKEVVKQSVKG
ncbi:hypothetical protein [Bacillus cereus]|uniref:hypothetical protein n=1 Tax=Bacillus cereus TaxID=1396 RepID=UPI0020D26F38|nr:hypothetical protein [Bacillus cereus]